MAWRNVVIALYSIVQPSTDFVGICSLLMVEVWSV